MGYFVIKLLCQRGFIELILFSDLDVIRQNFSIDLGFFFFLVYMSSLFLAYF